MDKQLETIMKTYLDSVRMVCHKLMTSLNASENLNLRTKYDLLNYRIMRCKAEYDIGEVKYVFHGSGCYAYDGHTILEWDFGYGSRWCGIDPWKLAFTLEKNKDSHIEYYDGNTILRLCEEAVRAEDMELKYGQYYFALPDSEKLEVEFPANYDAVVIKYFGEKWRIARNSLTDRFIRKSTSVYKQSHASEDVYTLEFWMGDEMVYSIFYNDVCYPPKAILIMKQLLAEMRKQF